MAAIVVVTAILTATAMINIDFVNIDHARMVGRLLPFWARGRKMALLIQALIYPLKYAHSGFKKWAFERFVENHITGQKLSLEWYLKYRLKAHFADSSDKFFVTQSITELKNYLSQGLWDNDLLWNNYRYWENGHKDNLDSSTSKYDKTTIVYAPKIVETVSYDYADYERDIRYIMSKYMINFSKINIIFANN